MVIKKSGKHIYGAVLTAAEKKAVDIEIQKEIAEYTRKHNTEIAALVLRELRRQFGFGEKRLRQFYEGFDKGIDELIGRYEMEESDDIWLCTQELKEAGIDIEKWSKEMDDS